MRTIPDYLVHETFTQNFWKGHSLGRPILGTVKTVSSFTQQVVFDYYAGRFTPRNMVFSAAGHLDHDTFVAQVADHFSGLAACSEAPLAHVPAPATYPHITLKRKKSLEQVQLCLGVPAPPVASPARYGVYLLNSMLGGGMSSPPLPDRPRRPRPRLLHLLRDQSLPRHRLPRHLRRHLRRKDPRGPSAYASRNCAVSKKTPSRRQS